MMIRTSPVYCPDHGQPIERDEERGAYCPECERGDNEEAEQ
ncbi:MAG: hypothetical protein VW338_14570 [Rhodospirillaceae bacterium]